MKTAKEISPTILAIESGGGACSIAVWKNDAITACIEEKDTASQAKRIIIMVEEALEQSGIGYNDLTSIATTIGPGSFTGIRIGLASARAIGFSANIPVMGFNTLAVIALAEKEIDSQLPFTAAINAGKGEIVYQHFDEKLCATCAPTLINAKENKFTLGIARADLLAKLAANYPDNAVDPVPFYVRPPDAKLPSK